MVLISKFDVLAVWESYMKKGQDIEDFITVARALRETSKREFRSIIERNKTYKKDNNAFFQKHYPHLLKRDTLAGQKRKMDKLLEEFGTKWERKGPKKETPTKVKTRVKVIFPKNRKDAEDNPIPIPSPQVLQKFAEITEGEVLKDEIIYPKLKNVGEWREKWNEIFTILDSKGNRVPKYPKVHGPMTEVAFLKTFRPQVVDGIVIWTPTKEDLIELGYDVTSLKPFQGQEPSKETPVKKYEVNTFDMEMLRRYLDILNRKSAPIKMLLPKTQKWKDGSERPLGQRMKELVYTTITGKSIRTNPYMNVLLHNTIKGSNWFNILLRQTRINEILSHKQIEDMIIQDIAVAWDENESTSPLFGIDIPEVDNIPTTMDQKKAYIRNKMKINSIRGESVGEITIPTFAGDTAAKLHTDMEYTISPETKKVLETILDDTVEDEPPYNAFRLNVKDRKKLFSRMGTTNLTFKEKNFGTIERYEMVKDDGTLLSSKDVKNLFRRIADLGEKNEEVASLIEGFKELDILADLSNFSKLLIQHESLEQKAKTGSLQGISLSQLDVDNLIRFFHLLDEMFGEGIGEGSVMGYYRKIDSAKGEDKIKLADELENKLGELLVNYREGFSYSFESRLREVLDKNGVGEGRNQVRPKIQKELVSKGIVREA